MHKISRPLGTFKESCGNCNFWNPVPDPNPIFTLRNCYKYYEGDAFMDNAKSFDPIPQDQVLIPLAQTPAHFKCAKYKPAQEKSDGTYESEYQIPQANEKFYEKQAQEKADRYGRKESTAQPAEGGNQKDRDERKATLEKKNELPERAQDEGIISADFPAS